MGITAKELAKRLKLSESAVSLALNNKPGVSTETRKRVLYTAKELGYDLSKISEQTISSKNINLVIYKREGAILVDTPFFSQLTEGIELSCKKNQLNLVVNILQKNDDIDWRIRQIAYSDCAGIILLGTEMRQEDFVPFSKLEVPIVLLDVGFDTVNCDCVLINNVQGAFTATSFLIEKTDKQPGYLHSSYSISNFEERSDGFYKAIRFHGMSTSKSIVHRLSPSVEGAMSDMLSFLERGDELADCYFADNDLIAIGAIKAFLQHGLKIPEDIAIVGFDDMPGAEYIEPTLTTMNVPKQYMGEVATLRLLELIKNPNALPVKNEIFTTLVKRRSV